MSDIVIRDAEPEDLPRIREILNEAIANTAAVWSMAPVSLESRLDWLNERRSAGYPIIVACLGVEVVGFGSYGGFRPWEAYKLTVEHSVYVDKSARRLGVGGLILRELVARARAAGMHVMVGGVEAMNTASLELHRRHGFQMAGTLPQVGRKFDRWLDLVFCTLVLA